MPTHDVCTCPANSSHADWSLRTLSLGTMALHRGFQSVQILTHSQAEHASKDRWGRRRFITAELLSCSPGCATVPLRTCPQEPLFQADGSVCACRDDLMLLNCDGMAGGADIQAGCDGLL